MKSKRAGRVTVTMAGGVAKCGQLNRTEKEGKRDRPGDVRGMWRREMGLHEAEGRVCRAGGLSGAGQELCARVDFGKINGRDPSREMGRSTVRENGRENCRQSDKR